MQTTFTRADPVNICRALSKDMVATDDPTRLRLCHEVRCALDIYLLLAGLNILTC